MLTHQTPKSLKIRKSIYMKNYRVTHKEEISKYVQSYKSIEKQRYLNLKYEVLSYYGNGKSSCVKCGFNDIRALTLDHINGDGCEKRREIKIKGGVILYKYLKENFYPKGYQTLCMCCQFLKKEKNGEYNSSNNKFSILAQNNKK